jgi:hypothetical protein
MHCSFRIPTRPIIISFAIALTAFALPASAMDGRTAVEICINATASGENCVWAVNDKGEVDICSKSGCVYCPSATGECKEAAARDRPTRTLPLGARVSTPVGTIKVTPSILKGSILQSTCPQGELPCPGHGCLSTNTKCDPVM